MGAWWRDVGSLVAIGLLDEPGVRLYALRGNVWRDLSTAVSRSLDPGGRRLGRQLLQQIRVIFSVPAERVSQLEGVRRRGSKLRAAAAARRPG